MNNIRYETAVEGMGDEKDSVPMLQLEVLAVKRICVLVLNSGVLLFLFLLCYKRKMFLQGKEKDFFFTLPLIQD